jgi:hypothetical protein
MTLRDDDKTASCYPKLSSGVALMMRPKLNSEWLAPSENSVTILKCDHEIYSVHCTNLVAWRLKYPDPPQQNADPAMVILFFAMCCANTIDTPKCDSLCLMQLNDDEVLGEFQNPGNSRESRARLLRCSAARLG